MKPSGYLISGVLALVLAACSNDAGTEQSSASMQTQDTEITQEQGLEALARLHLAEQGDVTWDERTFADGAFTFTNVQIKGDEAFGTAGLARLVIDAPRIDDNDDVRFDRVEVEGFSQDDDETTVEIGSIRFEHPGPLLAQAMSAGFDGRDYSFDGEITDEVINGFGFALYEMRDVNVTTKEEGNAFDFTMQGLDIQNLNGEGLELFSLTGLNLAGEDEQAGPIRMDLGETRLEGLSPELVRLMLETILRDEEGKDDEAQAMNFNLNPAEAFERFVMDDLDFDLGGVLVTMPNMTAVNERQGGNYLGTGVMESMVIAADGTKPSGAQLAMGLNMLGYDQIKLSVQSETLYDPEADRATTQGENYILIEDGVRIDFEQDVAGLQESQQRQFEAMAAGQMDASGMLPTDVYDPILIHGLAMHIEDRSLLERGINAAAAANGGMDPAMMRQQASAMVALGLAAAPAEIPRPLVAQLGDALATFIREGGTISVEMSPETPLSIGEAIRSSQNGETPDLEAWGLSVTHEAPAQ